MVVEDYMLVIPVKINETIYYINATQPTDNVSNISNKVATYKKIINYINLTINRISPKDISIKDVSDFRFNYSTETLTMNSGSYSVAGPYLPPDSGISNNRYYYYTVTSYSKATSWTIYHQAFTPNDLKTIGSLLKTLILNSHTHAGSSGAQDSASSNCTYGGCCNSAVIW